MELTQIFAVSAVTKQVQDIAIQIRVMGLEDILNPGVMIGGMISPEMMRTPAEKGKEQERLTTRLVMQLALKRIQDNIHDLNELLAGLNDRLADQFSHYADEWLEGVASEVLTAPEAVIEMPGRSEGMSDDDYEHEINKALAKEMLERDPATGDYHVKENYQDSRYADLAERALKMYELDKNLVLLHILENAPTEKRAEIIRSFKKRFSSPEDAADLRYKMEEGDFDEADIEELFRVQLDLADHHTEATKDISGFLAPN